MFSIFFPADFGGITQKTQVHKGKDQEQKKTTYDLNYTYGEEQPHAPIHIGDQTYSYDANGNQTGWTDDKTGQRRNIMWDACPSVAQRRREENRIRSIYDNGSQHHYIYDAAGERVLKGKGAGQRIFVNGECLPAVALAKAGDNTQNVKAGGDKAAIPAANLMGGLSEYSYEYDDFNN